MIDDGKDVVMQKRGDDMKLILTENSVWHNASPTKAGASGQPKRKQK